MSSHNIEVGIVRSNPSTYNGSAQIGDAVIRSVLPNKLLLQTGTGLGVTIDASNNVGFGTYSPLEKVDIIGFVTSTSGYKIHGYELPLIDLSGNFKTAGKMDISGSFAVNNDKFTVNSSGNVFANGNLDVSGNVKVSGTTVIASQLTVDDKVKITDTLDVSNNVTVKGNVFVVDTSNNRVGVNTGTPGCALHIVGDTRIEGNITVNGTTTIVNTEQQTTEQLLVTNNGTGPAAVINQIGSQPVIDFQDDGVSAFYIEDGGNVGINITDPIAKLDVSGNVNVRDTLKVVSNTDLSGNLNVTGTTTIGGAINITGALTTSGAATIGGNTTVSGAVQFNNSMGAIGPFDLSNNFRINTNQFTVDSSGNTDMSGNLYVAGDFVAAGDSSFLGDFHVGGNLGVAKNIDVSQNLRVNVDKFVVDSSGNMSSAGSFDLSNNFRINADKFTVNNSGNVYIAGYLDVARKTTIGTNVLYVDVSAAKVGVNNSSPSVELDISGNFNTNKAFVGQNDVSDNAIFGYKGLNKLTDFALTQTNTGKTIINSKATAGTIDFSYGGEVKQQLYDNGNIVIQGNIFTYSDARLKTNVVTVPNALDKVQGMRGVTYTMIKDGPEARVHVGLIAQEVEAVVPQAIVEENGYKTVAYGNLVGVLIEAIKELRAEVNELKVK